MKIRREINLAAFLRKFLSSIEYDYKSHDKKILEII